MNMNITKYLHDANQKVCPLISLEVECGMITHWWIRHFPTLYSRLSCRRILQFVGDNPDTPIYDYHNDRDYPMNVFIYNAIDRGMTLREIGIYIEQQQPYEEFKVVA